MRPQDVRSVGELRNVVRRGSRAKFVFFWGHQPPRGGHVDASCLSQWYSAPFELQGTRYPTAEHFMMAEKARTFGDLESEQRIISARNPGAAKRFGRAVRGFSQETWERERWRIAVEGNLAKFQQNEMLARFLVQTGSRVLVEVSPVDAIWGIGLGVEDERVENPELWRGMNIRLFRRIRGRRLAG